MWALAANKSVKYNIGNAINLIKKKKYVCSRSFIQWKNIYDMPLNYYKIVLRFFNICVISMASNYLFNYETIER